MKSELPYSDLLILDISIGLTYNKQPVPDEGTNDSGTEVGKICEENFCFD